MKNRKSPSKKVLIKESTLNLLKLTSILSPFYIFRLIYRRFFNLKVDEDTDVCLPVYNNSFIKIELIPENFDKYSNKVIEGVKKMKDMKVILCGCIRDGEEVISLNIDRMVKTGKMFKDYRIFIYESDSKDSTLEILREKEAVNNKIIIKSEKKHFKRYANHSRERMEIMAYCRNKYLDFIENNYQDFDYMIVVDLDLYGGWSNEGIANSFGYNDWDMIGANGLSHGEYYDSFPYRIKSLEDRAYYGGMQNKYDDVKVRINNVDWKKNRKPDFNLGQDLVPVSSCFSGMGIYKISSIKDCRYGSDDCEHVTFHRQMHNKGYNKFYINPSLLFILR